jgi:ion channel-forming bestrophin family protein
MAVVDAVCSDIVSNVRYTIARLPEGGEGAFGYDDGEGDD